MRSAKITMVLPVRSQCRIVQRSGQQAFLDITVTAVAFGQLRKQRRRWLADPLRAARGSARAGPRRYRPCVCAARLRDRSIVACGKIIVTIDFNTNEMITSLS